MREFINPTKLASLLTTRVKGREKKTKIELTRDTVAQKIANLEQLANFFDRSNELFNVDARTIITWVDTLNGGLADKLPPHIKQMIDNLPELDEDELIRAEQVLSEQLKINPKEIDTKLLELAGDEDKETAELAQQMQQQRVAQKEINEKIKPALREFALQSIAKLKGVAETELQMTDEELQRLEDSFKEIERTPEDYEKYSGWLKDKFISRNTELLSSQLSRIKERVNAPGYKVADREKQELYAVERDTKICEYIWERFFNKFKAIVDKKYPSAENNQKRINLLERLSGVTQPAFFVIIPEKNFPLFTELKVDEQLLKELGGEAKDIMEDYLRTEILDLVGRQNETVNQKSAEGIHNKILNLYYFHTVFPREDGTDVQKWKQTREGRLLTYNAEVEFKNSALYSDFNKSYEDLAIKKRAQSVNQGIFEAMNEDVEFLNQIESVARIRGVKKNFYTPILKDEYYGGSTVYGPELIVGTQKQSTPLKLQVRDGVIFEAENKLKKRQTEVDYFVQGLSDAINNNKTAEDIVDYTRNDFVRTANRAVVRAREAVIAAGAKALAEKRELIETGKIVPKLQEQIKDLTLEVARWKGELKATQTSAEAEKAKLKEMINNLETGRNTLMQTNEEILARDKEIIRILTEALGNPGFTGGNLKAAVALVLSRLN